MKSSSSRSYQLQALPTSKGVSRWPLEDRWVLFTGTPCQIAGLHVFLKKPYEKLLTVDMICHGVPSPMVWERYARQLEKNHGSKMVSAAFRNKDEGWRTYSLACSFENGSRYRRTVLDDLYLRGFVENLYLRPSCHTCAVKDKAYRSDLTVGDCWSKEVSFPKQEGTEGVSIALAHTEKGVRYLETLQNCFAKTEERALVLKSNPSYFYPVKSNAYRSRAIRRIRKSGTKKVLYCYCGNGLTAKIRHKLAKVFCG